jgi:hypothetical protein
MELDVPSQAVTAGRDRQSADHTDTPPARRPCPPNQWVQQKARFIDEYDLGLVRGKNPTRLSNAECGRRGSVPCSVARSPVRCVGRSTDQFRNRTPTLPSAGNAPGPAFGGRSSSVAGRVPAWLPGPWRRVVDTLGPSGRRFVRWSPACGQSRWGRSPVALGSGPSVAAAATSLDFHEVSYLMISASYGN